MGIPLTPNVGFSKFLEEHSFLGSYSAGTDDDECCWKQEQDHRKCSKEPLAISRVEYLPENPDA